MYQELDVQIRPRYLRHRKKRPLKHVESQSGPETCIQEEIIGIFPRLHMQSESRRMPSDDVKYCRRAKDHVVCGIWPEESVSRRACTFGPRGVATGRTTQEKALDMTAGWGHGG
jgi:hypothetical protein